MVRSKGPAGECPAVNRSGPRGEGKPRGGAASIAKRWAPLAFIAVLMAVGYFMEWHRSLSLSEFIRQRAVLQDYVSDHLAMALGLYGIVYVAATALSLPGGAVLTIVGGFLFGAALAGTVTIFAATLGATLIFCAARTALADTLRRKAGPRLSKLSEGFRQDALNYLLFLRLVPAFPFWLVNIAPALFDVRLRTFVIGTFIGIIPGTFAFAFVGNGLGSVIEAQEAANPGCAEAGTCAIDPAALATPELLIAFAALGGVALLPVLVKRLRRKKD